MPVVLQKKWEMSTYVFAIPTDTLPKIEYTLMWRNLALLRYMAGNHQGPQVVFNNSEDGAKRKS